ncbi:hypothetical protein HYH02_002484 [Chlamydomonas schloesseri]|uniref:Protein tyrosine phosphatase n=1 Tax=Chlamydomonas schloesseri TaxID=2026947 RepID=A0A836BBA4_9CHLO|nr:hypothetical protein HYH02_002484 [Chlamydomonas schloesseri]|eukprot:KAG2453158.1 hypothetical protein HYH02_002484 [Chlamydomonas schloesseri]
MAESAQDVRRIALGILQARLMDGRQIQDEYRSVLGRDHNIRASCHIAQAPGNSPKNRYVNVLPYDHNRVLLRTGGSGPAAASRAASNGCSSSGSSSGCNSGHINYAAFGMGGGGAAAAPTPDYINASHVVHDDEQCGFSLRYIASQGPLASTVPDFWRMVAGEDVGAVVMLTNTVERGVSKCAAYYPQQSGSRMPLRQAGSGQPGQQGGGATAVAVPVSGAGRGGPTAEADVDEVVAVNSRALLGGDLTQTQLAVLLSPAAAAAAAAEQPPREVPVLHLRYNAWPDHGTPADSGAIRSLCDLLAPVREAGRGVVVHCSAGIGRTGTFVAIDVMRRRLQVLAAAAAAAPGTVSAAAVQAALDLPELVHSLRRQRCGMVQTFEQYAFCYQALYEELAAALNAEEQQQQQQGQGQGQGGSGARVR